MALRWLINGDKVANIARDVGVGLATAYRYIHEAIDIIAARMPALEEALAECKKNGHDFVCLDGPLIECTRSSHRSAKGNDVW